MKNKRLVSSAILILGLGFTGLLAQEAILATGGNALSSKGSVNYSVGQVAYGTNTGSDGSLAQGVQQPLEISEVTGIEEAKWINLTVSAYPNPATDYLLLKVDSDRLKDLSYQLHDMNGKLLVSERIERNHTSIVMSNLVPSYYFLSVIFMKKEVKVFKIIKN